MTRGAAVAEPLGTLLLTHSSRRTNLARCSAEFLARRFADPERLRRRPPFESLPPAAPLYSGALSAWRVERGGDGRLRLRRLGGVRHRDKIQHATVAGETELLVGFEHRVERWRLAAPLGPATRLSARAVAVEAVLEHPHLAGLHTVEPLPGGRAAVSSAAADAVLVLDLAAGPGRGAARTLRLPRELYGEGYALRPERTLRDHYPDDERQATHLNAASPDRAGRRLAVSALIPGAVGVFDLGPDRGGEAAYRELVRGHVGCHGARFDDRGAVYFTDSPAGELIVLAGEPDGPGDGPPEAPRPAAAAPIARRFAVGSRWLHDAVQVAGPVFAFALADANELRLYDTDRGELLWRERFLAWPVEGLFPLARRWPGWLGNSTQALSFHPAG
jgi:hypothetical protein